MSETIKVRVLYFGATAAEVGQRSEDLELPIGSESHEAFDIVLGAHPRLAAHKLLFSVNKEYASGHEKLTSGDELAVFTAVSGG